MLRGSACVACHRAGSTPEGSPWLEAAPPPLKGLPLPTWGALGGGQPLGLEAGRGRQGHPQRTQGLGLQPRGDTRETLGLLPFFHLFPATMWQNPLGRTWAPVWGQEGLTGAAPSPRDGVASRPGPRGGHGLAGACPSPVPTDCPHTCPLLSKTWWRVCLLLGRGPGAAPWAPGPRGHHRQLGIFPMNHRDGEMHLWAGGLRPRSLSPTDPGPP